MAVAIRTITRVQDADDAPALGAGQNGYALTWNNATGAFVATALFTGGLLATGATTGATSQAQTFTNGIIGPSWKPAADSTTALQLQTSGGANVLNVDTTNSRVGINTTTPAFSLDVSGAATIGDGSGCALWLRGGEYYAGVKSETILYFGYFTDTGALWKVTADTTNVDLDFQRSFGSYLSTLFLQRSTGRVGIGTTAPATALHVVGAATITGGIRPAADSTTALQLQNASGTSILDIDTTNARVGIGTTAPAHQLHIGGGDAAFYLTTDPQLVVSSTTNNSSASIGLIVQESSNNPRASFYVDDLNSSAGISLAGSINVPNFVIKQGDGNDLLTINGTSGYTGIGTTAPAEALDVTGNINATGVVKVDDVQVLSNRVIDARCADVANSGDATTDGLIDALRDAMIAHGLIAAA